MVEPPGLLCTNCHEPGNWSSVWGLQFFSAVEGLNMSEFLKGSCKKKTSVGSKERCTDVRMLQKWWAAMHPFLIEMGRCLISLVSSQTSDLPKCTQDPRLLPAPLGGERCLAGVHHDHVSQFTCASVVQEKKNALKAVPDWIVNILQQTLWILVVSFRSPSGNLTWQLEVHLKLGVQWENHVQINRLLVI